MRIISSILLVSEVFGGCQSFHHPLFAVPVHDMGDAVAHVQGAGCVAGEYFGMDMFHVMIKEYIVAGAGQGEIVKHEAGQGLNGVGKPVRRSVFLQRYIQFPHAAQGIIGNGGIAVLIFMDQGAKEIFSQNVIPVVIVFQPDNLGMRMPLGAAGSGTVVAEVKDRLEPFVRFQLQPVGKAKGNDFMELFRFIGGKLPVVV